VRQAVLVLAAASGTLPAELIERVQSLQRDLR
jgi:hypothetical protein